jgi:hypothetical protein
MRKWGWMLALTVLAAMPAAAQTPWPDLRGTWKGESESIVTGTGNAHHAAQPQEEPRLSSVPFTLTINKQDGRRFSGIFLSAHLTESIIGVLTRAGTLLLVPTKGYSFGTLLGLDRLELCYVQIESYGRVASCTEMTRQRS